MLRFDASIDLSELNTLLRRRGLEPGGKVQRLVDNAVIRYCDPKVPFATGTLKHSAITASVPGSGLVVYATPYARYLYYGEIMGPNIPVYEHGVLTGFFSLSSRPKHLTGRPLTYNGAPERGSFWFERMMAEHKRDIIREAARAAGGAAGR